MPVKSLRFFALVFLFAFFSLLVARACVVPVWGSTEAREAQVAELVANTGELILPLRNGLVPSKPPLLHWLSALLIAAFGISGLCAARIVSAGACILTMYIVASFCSRLGHRNECEFQSRYWVALGILATTYGFFSLGSDARVDMLLCFLVTGAGLDFVTSHQELEGALPAERLAIISRMQYRIALWCGLAVLAKGPLGVVFPALVALITVCTGKRRLWLALVPRVGPLAVFLAIALPWYLAATWKGGSDFIERQLLFENLSRFAGGEDVNSKHWYFYLPVIFSTAIPWTVIGLMSMLQSRFGKVSTMPVSSTARVAFLIWVLGVVALSLAEGKRASYLLVLLPWVAVQVTDYVANLLARENVAVLVDRGLRIVFIGMILLTTAASLAVVVFHQMYHDLLSVSAVQSASCLIIWLIFALCFDRFFWSSHIGARCGMRLALLGGIAVILASAGLAIKGTMKGYEESAHEISRVVNANATLFAVRTRSDETFDPLFYLLRRPIIIVPPEGNLIDGSGSVSVAHGFLLASKKWLLEKGVDTSRFIVELPQGQFQNTPPGSALVALPLIK